jgi:CRISPR system Cascade subunit CasA
MNLLKDVWIPVRLRSGDQRRIRPSELTRDLDGPECVVALDLPRADFQGAMFEFLVGLLQTAVRVASDDDWRDAYESPPEPEALEQAFSRFASAFELAGDGIRFGQDANLSDADERRPIQQLLIDSPGENTVKQNADLFVRAGRVEVLCLPCSAVALYTLQANAPGGGAGHRTGLRGGGPWCSVVIEDPALTRPLWHSLWLNVLSMEDFESKAHGNVELTAPADTFPWLDPSALASGKGKDLTSDQVSPWHLYWTQARRIRLVFESSAEGENPPVCDLCASTAPVSCRSFATKPYGLNYTGAWRHPLTPRYVDAKQQALPVHLQPGGIAYRHFTQVTQDTERGHPAPVVHLHLERTLRRKGIVSRIWSFGYDMDNMKARGYAEALMPTEAVPEDADARRAFGGVVNRAVAAADEMGGALRTAVVSAVTKGDSLGTDKALGMSVTGALWRATEASFYAHLLAARASLDAASELGAAETAWVRLLGQRTKRLFDELTDLESLITVDPRRAVEADSRLRGAIAAIERKYGGDRGAPQTKTKKAKPEAHT